jgi:hypothetical protein
MQTVLITGGTGLVGKSLTQHLLNNQYKVIILSRSVQNNQANANLSYALWDVKKQQIDIAAIKAADYIVHLAGAGVVDKKWTDAYKKEIIDSRIESSKLLLDAVKNNENKVKAIVSASAIGWYGADAVPVKPFIETDEADDSFLGLACKLWEDSVSAFSSLGKRVVKIRIGIVMSNDGGALAEFKKPVKLGVASILGSGKQMVSWIHIDDLCRAFIAGIENDKMDGSYNAVAPLPVSNKTLSVTLAKAMNGNFYIPLHVPEFVLKIMMGDRSIEVLKSATVSCEKLLKTGFTFQYNSIEETIANLIKK